MSWATHSEQHVRVCMCACSVRACARLCMGGVSQYLANIDPGEEKKKKNRNSEY